MFSNFKFKTSVDTIIARRVKEVKIFTIIHAHLSFVHLKVILACHDLHALYLVPSTCSIFFFCFNKATIVTSTKITAPTGTVHIKIETVNNSL